MRYEVRVNGKTFSHYSRPEDALNNACVQLQANLGSSVEILDTATGRPIDSERLKLWCSVHPPN